MIGVVAPSDLAKIVGRYVDIKDMRRDAGEREPSLSEAIAKFDASARAGRYYESFLVKSSNCTMNSSGTMSFIADFLRLLDRCVTASSDSSSAVYVRGCFEKLLALHRYIDECNDDIIFFADEGGAWQIQVDWREVFPAYFRCLGRTTDQESYERIVIAAIDEFDRQSRKTHLAAAREHRPK
ncbi:MAG: hypothetical protein NT062_36880 [Proteobacteria bacterium]|nr:hypothetical protein [Pseudomonadota bacterium]